MMKRKEWMKKTRIVDKYIQGMGKRKREGRKVK